jgi:hypothetical protein
MLKYRIRYAWPDGKVRYRKDFGLCKSPEDATVFTLIDASAIIRQSNDARILWDIVTTKEACNDSPILPLLHDPDEAERKSSAPKHRTRKKRSRKSRGS